MTPGSVLLLTAGLILLVSGIKNRSFLNTITGNPQEENTGSPKTTTSEPDTGGDSTTPPSSNSSGHGRPLSGYTTFDGHLIASWIKPVLVWARGNGWKGRVISGYRSTAEQKRICDSGVRPCATPGKSEHQSVIYPGGAVDVDDYQTLAQLVPKYPGPGPTLIQATFANDPGHFSGNGH